MTVMVGLLVQWLPNGADHAIAPVATIAARIQNAERQRQTFIERL
jgi:hypothetical protein